IHRELLQMQNKNNCEVVILMVSDDEACEEVFTGTNGLFSSQNTNLIVINMSTITPKGSVHYSSQCLERGIKYIEAPVSGTLPHARNKNLIIFAAGDQNTFSHVEPILNLIGRKISYFGVVGNAARVKLIINGILAVQTAVLAEGLNIANKFEIDSSILLEIINDSALGNIISKVKGSNMIEGSHQPLFRFKYMIKDLKYGLEEFQSRDIETPLISRALETYEKGQSTEAESDFSAIMNVYQ
ncbi:MAG: NAD(P)-dependent oxidoreductase, partial [Candidatus Heimdallarchaeota archaeon]